MGKVVVAFDYDGCMDIYEHERFQTIGDMRDFMQNLIKGSIHKEEDKEILKDYPALNKFQEIVKAAKAQGNQVIVRCASNRQSVDIDERISCDKPTADRCFRTMFCNVDGVEYNPNRLEDTIGIGALDVEAEDTKFATLIDQMHAEAENLQSKKSMTYTFMDDREDILDRVKEFFSDNTDLIPKGVELKLIHTPQQKDKEKDYQNSIPGTGYKIDAKARAELVFLIMAKLKNLDSFGWNKYRSCPGIKIGGWPARPLSKSHESQTSDLDTLKETIKDNYKPYQEKAARKAARKAATAARNAARKALFARIISGFVSLIEFITGARFQSKPGKSISHTANNTSKTSEPPAPDLSDSPVKRVEMVTETKESNFGTAVNSASDTNTGKLAYAKKHLENSEQNKSGKHSAQASPNNTKLSH